MKSADLRKRHELATADRLDRASVGRIRVQRQVTSGAMIIVQVGCQDPPKMDFVKDDDMVETFAPDRTDDALDVWRLPGRHANPARSWRSDPESAIGWMQSWSGCLPVQHGPLLAHRQAFEI